MADDNVLARAEDFDPPLNGEQMKQVQNVINEAIRRNAVGGERNQFLLGELTHLKTELASPPVGGGWKTLGSHVDKPDLELEFWGDDGGVPIWERPVLTMQGATEAAEAWADEHGRTPQSAEDIADYGAFRLGFRAGQQSGKQAAYRQVRREIRRLADEP